MHLVYIVRPGQNEELRYSLRSAAVNLPVESVTIVGDAPDWVTGVRRIPGNRYRDKPRNVLDNVRIAAEAPGLPDHIVLMNDDFFILEAAATVPVLFRGPLTAHVASYSAEYWWPVSLQRTLVWLQAHGHEDPLSYELHTPFPVDREGMRDALGTLGDAYADNPPQWRSVYGNLARIGGTHHPDEKVSTPSRRLPDGQFVSTNDVAFYAGLARPLRALFPHPSPFEARPRRSRKDTPVTLYKNVTTNMLVDDNTGRLDGLARWRRLSDDEVAALTPAEPKPAPVADAPVFDDTTDTPTEAAPAEPKPADGGPEDAEPEAEKPKRTRTKKAE